ncbi:MAG: PAS domain S-box protein [Cyanomargarita calcarea GSE-NOS-MK-12-04C]|jgi:diguanylate cyclase (GGDEF)-like protein/PAS domain S-box-containing protein|uniref:PAS domain S-box protein n=1 Tax=Cyanomargarita calcarea GSE-NOS-MK-12-04C TaxID=2839659 RepID=A0A951UX22_9CYAN|nr:PAS domain S-box protein [Cyanomargarita calcarea GSE-NOS-MK-12-04C]
MNTIVGKILVPHYVEYLAIAHDLVIGEVSSGAQRFADCPNEVIPGKDIRLGFPELVGSESYLIDILEGRQKSFELKGIARFNEPNSPLYIDLYITGFEGWLIVLLEDATKRMVLEQKLVQTNHETNLLLSALSTSHNYIDKIIRSIRDVLLVTTQSGNIIRVNQAAIDLFEYSQEELINQRISTIIADESLLLPTTGQNTLDQSDFLKDCEVVCQTKSKKKLTVAFSFSVIETEIKGLQNFVYTGRDITQRKRTEQLQDVEHTTTRILANSATLLDGTTEILSIICSNLGWELGEFWSVDRQAKVLLLGSTWHMPSLNFPKFELSHQMTFSTGVGLPGRVWASGQPVWINDVVFEQNFLRRESAKIDNLHGAFGFPIKCGSEIKGVMTFFSHKIQEPESDLLTMMTVIGSQIGQFILRFEAEAALRESEERFQAFMNNSPAVAFMKDSEGRYVYTNKQFEHLFNVKHDDLLFKTDFDWLPEQTAKEVYENDLYVLTTSKPLEVIETVPTPDGCLHYWLVFKFPFKDGQKRLVGGVAVDITERKLLEQALFEEKELAQVTLESIGDAVITTDASSQIIYLNPVAEDLTGWSLQDAQGKPLTEVFKVVNETTRLAVKNPVKKALRSASVVGLSNDSVLITRNGSEIAIDNSAAPIRAKDGKIVGAVMVFQDITHKRDIARQLSWQATHDTLTGLFNRREFEHRLQKALISAKTQGQQHILCCLDLDRFKIVNDTCGHIAGDELLCQVTTLFQSQVRSCDTLARLGGDEFAILFEVCPLEPAFHIANTLLQNIQEFRFVWQDTTFSITVSIGLVVINANSQSLNSVLSAADAACYAAKNKGRNCIQVYQTTADNELGKCQKINYSV